MSWDVRAGKWDVTKEHDIEHEDTWPAIGVSNEIYEKVKPIIEGIDQAFSHFTRIESEDYIGDVSFSKENSTCRYITFFVYGGKDPLKVIVQLCKQLDLVAFDTTSGKYIDLENPSDEGWVTHQNFLKSMGVVESGLKGVKGTKNL